MRPGTASHRRREEGQTLVEAAIMLPLYVFLILGLLQLGLMHQVRLLTKYAAYRAVRAGALANADRGRMEAAALGALLPVLSRGKSGAEQIQPVETAGKYLTKWPKFMMNTDFDLFERTVRVRVCGPTKDDVGGGDEIDFDAPGVAANSDKTKLRVQVEFLYRMPIPFANAVIYAFATGKEVTRALRTGEGSFGEDTRVQGAKSTSSVWAIPVRASYAMRMQSNVFPKNLPESSECVTF